MNKLIQNIKLQRKILDLQKKLAISEIQNEKLNTEHSELKKIIKDYDFIKNFPLGTTVFLTCDINLKKHIYERPYKAVVHSILFDINYTKYGFLVDKEIYYTTIKAIKDDIFLDFNDAISHLTSSEYTQNLWLMMDYFNISKNFNEKIGD